MQEDTITVFGETTFRNSYRKFGIKTDDRRRHMYLIGKTGMGKSTILENMIIEDINSGHGVAVVDPHGDLAEKVIEFVPNNRVNDVIYFNPADTEYPIAFNVVEEVSSSVRHLVASGLIGVFQKLWADSWGPRLEYILRNAILAILDYPGATLLSVTRMLSDKDFRSKVIENIKDPVVRAFWIKEFAGYNDKFASEAVSPIQNKVGQFLSSSLIRNIVGQAKSTMDMRKVMDERKILILNLSKGAIGEDNSMLLGNMIITKIQLAAMSRVNIPEKERKDFYLYVDEFQNFTSDSFANILSEARKYRLNLILAHQYIEQLTENVRNAVFGNVGTLIIFRVGAADAEALAPELAPIFMEEDILNLPKYEIYLKLMIDGIASEPFSARGMPPMLESEKTGNTEKVIRVSREKYAKARDIVEEKITTWHESIADAPASKSAKKAKNEESYKFDAKCNRCGIDTKTPFEPDGVRPVYCKDCLSDIKKEKQEEAEKRKEMKQEEVKNLDVKKNIEKRPPSKKNLQNEKPKFFEKNTDKNEFNPPVLKSAKKQTENSGISLSELGKIKPVGFSSGGKNKAPNPENKKPDNEVKNNFTNPQNNNPNNKVKKKFTNPQNSKPNNEVKKKFTNPQNSKPNNEVKKNFTNPEKQNKDNNVKHSNTEEKELDLSNGGEIDFN